MKFMATPLVYERRDKRRFRKVKPVYLEASNETLARRAAIKLYRMMQIQVKFVSVSEYHPWEDPDLLSMGWVRPISAPIMRPVEADKKPALSNVRPVEKARKRVATSRFLPLFD
jgi:hypothetical protein